MKILILIKKNTIQNAKISSKIRFNSIFTKNTTNKFKLILHQEEITTELKICNKKKNKQKNLIKFVEKLIEKVKIKSFGATARHTLKFPIP